MDYRDIAVFNERRLKEKVADLEAKCEELEQQFTYECECNKQFVETQNKCERLDVLLNNVCAYLCELVSNDTDFFTEEHSKLFFDMTEDEHKKYILGE